MRAFLDILHFEIRYQLRSPFLLGAMLIFALGNFLTITSTGININVSNLVDINSPNAILMTTLTVAAFGMLPMVVFVTTAIIRDFERNTDSLLYTTPITRLSFLLGRFSGVMLAALCLGLAGMLGALIGSFMPGLDQARIAPFSIAPWLFTFAVYILPNTVIICAIFFAVAALTRSATMTFAAALAFFVLGLVLNVYSNPDNASLVALLDPFGILAMQMETRYWTSSELNTGYPGGMVYLNRLAWLAISAAAILLTHLRFRLELAQPSGPSRRRATTSTPAPKLHDIIAVQDYSLRGAASQLRSQLKMDCAAILKSPLFYIVLLLGVQAAVADVQRNVSLLGETPLYPLTSLFVGFLRLGMLQFVWLITVIYSAILIHRDREFRTNEIIGAAPFPDWLMILSRILALCAVVTVLLLVVVLTFVVMQTLAGYTRYEFGLYFRALFVHNLPYFFMLCILAVVLQAVSPNKWIGVLLVVVAFIGLRVMVELGYDHPLYGFYIPHVIYSDMNGFGHFTRGVYLLTAYWGSFCILLVTGGHLFYPRGVYASWRERFSEARERFTPGVAISTAFAALGFLAFGSWIFYHTNILNEYRSPAGRLALQADYEKQYSQFENQPTPSPIDISMQLDIFPDERRLHSRGSTTLRNNKQVVIAEFVISVNPLLQVNELTIAGAKRLETDTEMGFYRFEPDSELQPGDTLTMTWDLERRNQGIDLSGQDINLVQNGTFVDSTMAMPIPGYDETRELEDNTQRAEHGLPPADRLPALGDPEYLDNLRYGVDGRASSEVIISTSPDQLAVAPGALQREWTEDGRRYFHYRMEAPTWPSFAFVSARYEVVRAQWEHVGIEIYHHPDHDFNTEEMIATAKQSFDYFTREYAPYPLTHFRLLEYPRYRTAAQAFPGTVPYSEAIGFITDLSNWQGGDYATIHELAHMWWGGMVYGAWMQGQQMLNETMAQYSTLMVFKENYPPVIVNRVARMLLDSYLRARSFENVAEQPVMYTEAQGYISYNKGALALYALQDIVGEDIINQGLRNFLGKYGMQPAPFPTSRDLVNELRAVAGPEYQDLITDLFEKIVLFDLTANAASARELDEGYEVTIDLTARQLESDERGRETETSLNNWFDIAVFPETRDDLDGVEPIYLEKYRLHSGQQTVTVRVPEKPGIVALDPFHKMIERTPGDNTVSVSLQLQ